MEIIATHRNADFDAIAAQIAAAKLYPGAIPVSAGGTPPVVRKFLTLHRDHFERTPVKAIDMSAVSRMIVVDVRPKSRLKDFGPLLARVERGDPSLDVHIYDHHGASPDDLIGHSVCVAPVGSATTLLVERLISNRVTVTPIEATALALGIYADTGSLTYTSTSVRDAEAATFLLRHGASMTTLRYFLHAPLGQGQREVLAKLVTDATVIEFSGVRLGVSTVPLKRAIPGLSELVNQALMLAGNDAAFAFFTNGETVTIIGRSWVPALDVGRVMQKLGGGGHSGAGSATLKKTNIRRAKAKLMAVLQGNPPTPQLVRYLMITPVFTLSPEQILDDVQQAFEDRRVSGAPVLKNGKLAGLLSKRDIAAAKAAGRSHLSVASCMTQEVKTIGPDRSLVRAFEEMVAADVGRLPVVEGDHLIGIITRNDILKILYKADS